jgi:hypothetical protein
MGVILRGGRAPHSAPACLAAYRRVESTAYNLTMGLVGGTAPIVATWMIDRSDRPLAAALYLMVAGAVSAAAVLSVRSFSPRGEGEFAVAGAGTGGKGGKVVDALWNHPGLTGLSTAPPLSAHSLKAPRL